MGSSKAGLDPRGWVLPHMGSEENEGILESMNLRSVRPKKWMYLCRQVVTAMRSAEIAIVIKCSAKYNEDCQNLKM